MVAFEEPSIERIKSWIGKSNRLGDAEFTVTHYKPGSAGTMVYGVARSQYGVVKRIHAAYWLAKYI